MQTPVESEESQDVHQDGEHDETPATGPGIIRLTTLTMSWDAYVILLPKRYDSPAQDRRKSHVD
jgi:hypothetical protein